MILDLPEKRKPKEIDEWHEFWCFKPRVIENKLVWLSRAERRYVTSYQRFDGATSGTYTVKIWEYKLIQW